MGSEGKEGVLYACGEWEHGQLGFPFQRSFTIEGEVKAYDMEVGVPTLARMPCCRAPPRLAPHPSLFFCNPACRFVSRFLKNCAEQSQVPSTGKRIIGKNTVLEPIPAIDADEHVSTPQVIPFMRKHHVIKISAGGDHSMAVCPPPVCTPVDAAQNLHGDVVWQVTDAGRVLAFGDDDHKPKPHTPKPKRACR